MYNQRGGMPPRGPPRWGPPGGYRGGGFRGRGGPRGPWMPRGGRPPMWRGPPRGGHHHGPPGQPPRPRAPPPHVFVQHVPFDFVVCEQSFPRIKPELSEGNGLFMNFFFSVHVQTDFKDMDLDLDHFFNLEKLISTGFTGLPR